MFINGSYVNENLIQTASFEIKEKKFEADVYFSRQYLPKGEYFYKEGDEFFRVNKSTITDSLEIFDEESSEKIGTITDNHGSIIIKLKLVGDLQIQTRILQWYIKDKFYKGKIIRVVDKQKKFDDDISIEEVWDIF